MSVANKKNVEYKSLGFGYLITDGSICLSDCKSCLNRLDCDHPFRAFTPNFCDNRVKLK